MLHNIEVGEDDTSTGQHYSKTEIVICKSGLSIPQSSENTIPGQNEQTHTKFRSQSSGHKVQITNPSDQTRNEDIVDGEVFVNSVAVVFQE